MKILLDENISFRIINKINHLYTHVKSLSELGLLGLKDNLIWKYAEQNNFAILTYDEDFSELSILHGHPPKVIWLRASNLDKQGFK